jgi:glycosyltransferase involved in cell wall biosynthesis
MKIVIIGTRGFPNVQGGVEQHCQNLYLAMEQEKIKIIVFRRKPYINKIGTNFKSENIDFIDLPSTQIKGFETVFHSFISTLYALKLHPDIVHIHNIGPALFSPILKCFGIKIVLTYHSANYEHKKWGRLAKSILKISELIALKTANSIIYVNKFQMDKTPTKYKYKSFYIPNGIPNVIPSQNINYLKSLNIVPHQYILSVGRITEEKGFDILIKAFAMLDTKYKLVIAGGVETEYKYLKELKSLISPDRIVFTGYVTGENLNQLYTNAQLYVLASRYEGFPLVLLEAMSYGLDVLVSDIPATHLVNLNANDYFPLEDHCTLAQRISDKLKSPKHRTYQLQEFNWKAIAQKTFNIYKKIL